MPRSPRQLPVEHCFHVTVRCNNREFRLTRFECRAVLLYALDQARSKFGFKLFGLYIKVWKSKIIGPSLEAEN